MPTLKPISRTALFLSATLLSALLIGCGPKGNSGGGSPSGGSNILKYALQTAPTNLDPALVEDGDTIDLIRQMFEGLVMWDEKSEIVPNIAEKWDISADGKVYTFHLHDNVKFHNGRKATASDFVYSLTRAQAPEIKSPVAMTYLNDILGAKDLADGKVKTLAGIKAIDDKTLQITLDYRRPYFLGKLTLPTSYLVCKEAIEQNGGKFDEKTMIGTGPFKLDFYQSGSMVKMAAFKEYHGQKPIVDGIERPVKTDSFTRQTAYDSGDTDFTDVQRGDVERIKSDPIQSKEMKTFPRANTWFLQLSQFAFEPFKKREVRQAFAYAINKDEIIRIVYKGTALRATGILPPGIPGHDNSYAGMEYDPKKAQELLAKAGYPGGKGFPKLTITYRQGYQYIAEDVQRIRNDLKQNLGIEVETKESDWAKMLDDSKKHVLQCTHARWGADYLDAQNYLSVLFRTGVELNRMGYSNPEFDKLCDRADVEPDPAKRTELYKQAERIAVEDAPWVCLFHLPDVEVHKPYVKGVQDSLMGHLPHTTVSVKH